MDDFAISLEAEIAAEAFRRSDHGREAARHKGVAWSAVTPAPYRPVSMETLSQRAQAVADARRAWRTTTPARFLNAIIESQQISGLAHQACERARAAWSRDADGETQLWIDTAVELEGLALRLLKSARLASALISLPASPPRDHADAATSGPPTAAHE